MRMCMVMIYIFIYILYMYHVLICACTRQLRRAREIRRVAIFVLLRELYEPAEEEKKNNIDNCEPALVRNCANIENNSYGHNNERLLRSHESQLAAHRPVLAPANDKMSTSMTQIQIPHTHTQTQ